MQGRASISKHGRSIDVSKTIFANDDRLVKFTMMPVEHIFGSTIETTTFLHLTYSFHSAEAEIAGLVISILTDRHGRHHRAN